MSAIEESPSPLAMPEEWFWFERAVDEAVLSAIVAEKRVAMRARPGRDEEVLTLLLELEIRTDMNAGRHWRSFADR